MNRKAEIARQVFEFLQAQVVFQRPPAFGERPTGSKIDPALIEPPPRALGAPPETLRDAHDTALLSQLWSRLVQVVREPTHTVLTGDIRWVQVTGVALLAFMPDGTVQAFLHEPTDAGFSRPELLDPWTLVLQGCPYRDLWLKALARLAGWDVQQHARRRGVALSDRQAEAYAQWAFAHFGRLLVRHTDLRQMRTRVARVLAFEPAVVAMAARLPVTTRSDALILLGAYNRVQRHRAAFDAVAREAPNLLPLFGALCDSPAFPEEGEAVARLRKFLVQTKGLSPRTWRYLCQEGARALKPLAEFYTGDVGDATLEHLKLLDQLAVDRTTPQWLVRTVLAGWGDAGNRWASYALDVAQHPELWAHVARTVSKADAAAIEPDAFDLVRRWIFDLPRGVVPDSQQRAAGWPWLERQAQEWAGTVRRRAECQATWSTWTETVLVDRWTLRPLNSALALWEEALAMRHCAQGFVGRCESGGSVMFSVFDGSRHVATALMDRTSQGWCLDQVKGFANATVPVPLATRLAAWMAGLPATVEDADEAGDPIDDEDPVESETDDDEDLCLDDNGDEDEEEDDAAYEEEDPVEQSRRVVAMACDLVHGGVLDPNVRLSVYMEVESLLDRWNDQGDLSYRAGGRQVLHDQVRNWTLEIEAWLQRALDDGYIDEERFAVIDKRRKPLKALRPEELAMFDEMFVEDILGRDAADCDVYGSWGAECLRDEAGREAWAIYRIKGYSFTSVELSLLGLCADVAGVKEILEGQGRYSGSLPLPSNTLKGRPSRGADEPVQRPGQGSGQ